MRIIAGKLKGRKLVDSSKLDLRPTSDMNRQALFNILSSGKFIKEINFDITDATVLDICSGTGAVSFEALSRGAKSSLMVDKNQAHIEIAKKNADHLGLVSEVSFLLSDVKNLRESKMTYDLIYIDPPYEISALPFVRNLIEKKYFGENSLIVVESDKEISLEELTLLDKRKYGRTYFSFYKFTSQTIQPPVSQ